MFFNREHTRTPFVQLDTHTCQNDAFSRTGGAKKVTEKRRQRTLYNFLINNLLLVSGLAAAFSGLALQLGFHMGGPHEHQAGAHEVQSALLQYEQLREIDTSKIVFGFNYYTWSDIHKSVIVFFSLLMIYHTYVHWRWYKGVIAKHLISKNMQVIILSVLFMLVAITGLIPWFIDLSGNTNIFRMLFIEIHDKITFILIFFLILHCVKRIKWFITAYEKLRR